MGFVSIQSFNNEFEPVVHQFHNSQRSDWLPTRTLTLDSRFLILHMSCPIEPCSCERERYEAMGEGESYTAAAWHNIGLGAVLNKPFAFAKTMLRGGHLE